MGERPRWQRMHNAPFNTVQLMENLQPYATREHTDKGLVKNMCDQEKRFYKDDELSAKQKEINTKRKKTLFISENMEEKAKLMRLHKDLNNSRQLIDVEQDFDSFEKETNHTFNNMMNVEHRLEIQRSISNKHTERNHRYSGEH